jgi:predicted phosphodiesterase
MELDGQRLVLVHGSPRGERDVITRDTADDVVREMIAGIQADLLLYGHTHDPVDRVVDGVRLINPGAVGYPRNEPASARYALLAWEGAWRVDFCLVHYDVEQTIERLLAAERPYRLWVVEALRRSAHVPLTTLE